MILGRVILGNKLLDGALAPASQDPLRGLLFMCRVFCFSMGGGEGGKGKAEGRKKLPPLQNWTHGT